MGQPNKTYCEIIDYITKLSIQINNMYDICPVIFLKFNKDNEIGGATILTYRTSDMYIELDVPYNCIFGKIYKMTFACILIHEYCHYINALTMSGRERANSIDKYTYNQKCKRAEEQCNWTATKRLAKKLGLWNKAFYKTIYENYPYTSALQF